MKGKTIAWVGAGVAAAVGVGVGAFLFGRERGAQQAADAIDRMTPQALAAWKANGAAGGFAHAPIPVLATVFGIGGGFEFSTDRFLG